jgi:DNA-directed RNA polymerase specialized sigma24 family protein
MEILTASKTESLTIFYEEWYGKSFLQVAKFVKKRGGTLDDAKDIFHDALIVHHEKLQNPGFVLRSSEEAYLMGVVKNLWSQRIKSYLKSHTFVDNEAASLKISEEINESRLYKLVMSAGKKCLDLLSTFYIDRASLTDIAETFGFRTEHSAAVQKYKCIEKIRETIKQNSLQHEDFFE